MTPLDADVIAARAKADQGHQFFADFLDNLIGEYQDDSLSGGDPQDRRSMWMTALRKQLKPGEVLALLVIALDRLAHDDRQ